MGKGLVVQTPISEIEVDDEDREALVAFLKDRKEEKEKEMLKKKQEKEKMRKKEEREKRIIEDEERESGKERTRRE